MAHSSSQLLSDDLLYLIFANVGAIPMSIGTFSQIDIQKMAPLNFSQVCRSWRTTVSLHPTLWTTIHIKYAHYGELKDGANAPAISNFLGKWLQRSPYTLIECHLDLYGYEFTPDFDSLLSLLLSEWCRWKNIDVRCHPRRMRTNDRDPIIFRCSPTLKSIRLEMGGIFNSQHNIPVFLDLAPCTTLVTSQLRGLNTSTAVKWLIHDSPSLPTLRELRLSTDLGCDILAVFSACPKITSLFVTVLGEPQTGEIQSRSIILPRLTSLEIRSSHDLHTSHLLNSISCPSLQKLSLNESGIVTTLQGIRGIASLLSRSNVNRLLCELEIRYYVPMSRIKPDLHRENTSLMMDMLRNLSGLKKLKLSGFIVNDDIVKFLTIRPDLSRGDAGAVCPLAKEMEFTFTNVKREIIGAMIASRWEAGKKLRSVALNRVEFPDFADEDERVRSCSEEGLILSKC
ncbi:hypothetical protein SCHPADRAFT_697056 [Schizopora paradoxa]|uniref:Uncharacterized protein n=1 Tax=Schizopora paradoxa TaxID=27342 RepID=A0A0H2R9M9_9AGAM|nr:hypothetical protein SCHPADRAFT_697056 [Schizopora paradoxa]